MYVMCRRVRGKQDLGIHPAKLRGSDTTLIRKVGVIVAHSSIHPLSLSDLYTSTIWHPSKHKLLTCKLQAKYMYSR